MIPSLTNLVECNRLLFEGFLIRVIKFSIGNCMGAGIMMESTVNNCYYYSNISVLLQVVLYRIMQRLHFVVQCAIEFMGVNTCFLYFCR